MVGKIFAVLCIIAVIFGVHNQNMSEVSSAAVDGAARAVKLAFDLCGAMALWDGVMRVLEVKGAIRRFSRMIHPLLKLIFPDAAKKKNGTEEIGATLAANMLGIGNAATPLAMRAMKKLDENRTQSDIIDGRASDDMVTFAVMNTAAFSILPTGVLAMRSAFGSQEAFSVIPCIWICSAASCVIAVISCRVINRLGGKKSAKKQKKSTLYYNRE